jgi:hypothetical protein
MNHLLKRYLTVKKIVSFFIFGLLISYLQISCDSEKETKRNIPGFSIEVSDGKIIRENDILFYDSSTCILFLKENLSLIIGPAESPYNFTKFSVFVNEDKIYEGIFYPNMFEAASPGPFISSKTYPDFNSNILEIKQQKDIANDYRIIESLNYSNLLQHGISLTIDSVKISSYQDSTLLCSFTVKNNDFINYYIPDPVKMGVSNFNNYTGGGLRLKNKETGDYYYHSNIDNLTSDWAILTMEDLSILESKSKITFTYKSSYYPKIVKGLYKGDLRYNSMNYFLPVTLNLDQENGRVWVGSIFSNIDNIIFE